MMLMIIGHTHSHLATILIEKRVINWNNKNIIDDVDGLTDSVSLLTQVYVEEKKKKYKFNGI